MKLAHKFALTIVALLCAALAAGGSWTLERNFERSLAQAETQATYEHLRAQLWLEEALADRAGDAGAAQTAARYARTEGAAGGTGLCFSLLGGGGTVLWSNMPPAAIPFAAQLAALRGGAGELRYCRQGGAWHLLMAAPLHGVDGDVWLVSGHDVTRCFAEHAQQLRQYLALQATVLALAGAAALAAARQLTLPLRRLQAASQAIAAGQYDRRVPVQGRDEVAALAGSFNAMAGAVQSNTEALTAEAARRSRFVAAFTHELKTPMTAILGYADLLRSGEQPAELRRREADYIYHEAARLEHLSRELLALLGLEKGAPPALEPVAVPALFADVARIFSDGVPLRAQAPAAACVRGNPALLCDLLCNLVRNARAADAPGAPVWLLCTPDGGGWRLAVRDKGCGIAPEDLPHVTEAFYMADKSRTRAGGGSGLGLSLCAEIAKAHGSELHIDSVPGVGTEVWLVLPEGGAPA